MPKPPSQALLDELEALLGRSGFTRDQAEIEPWLSDWRGRYRGRAAALLSPASAAEVQAIVERCARDRVGIVPQGGNTSMVGGATPPDDGACLILSMRRMRAIRQVSPEDNLLVAEAGAILSEVHDAAAAAGRRFPLSLGAKGSATVGGLVSTNAGGTQVLRFGTMRALVLGIEAVLPNGALYEGLSALRKDNRGYDLKQLLTGAEGTLGVVTAASLRLVPSIGARAVAWVGLEKAGSALALLRFLEERLGDGVESFELVPDNALATVLRRIPGTRAPLAGAHCWNVLVEVTAPQDGPEPGSRLTEALEAASGQRLIEDAAIAASEAQAEAFWRLRETIAEAERAEGPAAKHDISVPVSAMPRFIEKARAAVEARFAGSRVIAFGHLGDGNVHFNVQGPLADAAWLAEQGEAVSRFVHDLVTGVGGSISAEHGIGQMKAAELVRTADPAHIAAQRAIKAALDPYGIMNPGKLFLPT